jgi:hypothetical protein
MDVQDVPWSHDTVVGVTVLRSHTRPACSRAIRQGTLAEKALAIEAIFLKKTYRLLDDLDADKLGHNAEAI